ncbi:TPA_asm: coat protein [ssRNA phage SRR6960551_5]|uniref:Coat protein n=1 Tax=ssRNA phage SRR6960551_5 TaxID=2786556 RepID=A0A8S5L5G6_9VIRU|nr:coat protein [ssRNA phage SRR6960551_5]DAD52623.1 TPA_asm: coat protein [ssRNA phage SRR6960551_5]
MAQAANLSLTVGAATVAYTLTGVQNGDLPTMWEAGPADGTLNFADTISHKISSGSANRNLSIKSANKVVGTIDGNPAVIRVLSGDLKITFPRDSTTVERTKILDTVIGFLNSQKANLASAQAYY